MVIELLHEDVEEGENEVVIIHRLRITYRRLLLMDDVQDLVHFFGQTVGHSGIWSSKFGPILTTAFPSGLYVSTNASLMFAISQNRESMRSLLPSMRLTFCSFDDRLTRWSTFWDESKVVKTPLIFEQSAKKWRVNLHVRTHASLLWLSF